MASYSELWFASQGGPRCWLQLREIPEEHYVQANDWSLSPVCSPFPAVTLPGYLADQGVQDSHERRGGNHTDLVDENPTQTLPLRRQLMRVVNEISAVRLTHRGARPVVQSTAAYLGGHRVWEGEANELHAMGPACAGSSQAKQLIADLKHHATNPPPATPQALLASAESAKR